MSQTDYSTLGGEELTVAKFRCDACGRSIRSSRPIAVGREVRCPVCNGMTRVKAESPFDATEPEPTRHAPPTGAPTAGRSVPASQLPTSPALSPRRAGSSGTFPVSVPGYTILGEIGRGAAGVVYRARHEALKRVVALKVLHVTGDGPAILLGEAEAVAKLHHPNIVQIYEIGEGDGRPYIALEYVAGGTLAARIEGKPQPIRAAARLIETLARAVQAAHARGLVHRDLKPGNLLIAPTVPGEDDLHEEDATTYGVVKIADFGLAMRLDRDDSWGCRPELSGTPQYMAPEQALGQVELVGTGVDVYALGVILFELLTGQRPFKAGSVEALLIAIAHEPVAPPRQIRPAVPRDLEAICLKCLAKSPADRYRSASALANDLHRFLQGEPVKARQSGPIGHAWRWSLRNPTAASLIGTAAVVLGLGLPSLHWLKRGFVQVSALQDAEQQSRTVREIWNVYTKVIGLAQSNLDPTLKAPNPPPLPKLTGTGFELSFSSRSEGNLTGDPGHLLPAPVTFIKLLGSKLRQPGDAVSGGGATGPASTFRIYSDFPLTRNDDSPPKPGTFGREALDALTADPTRTSFTRFEPAGGGEILRAAYPVLMLSRCLKCHNEPSQYDGLYYQDVLKKEIKLDWKEGDVRGVIEVDRPMDKDYAKTGDLLSWSLGILLAAAATVLLAARTLLATLTRRHS